MSLLGRFVFAILGAIAALLLTYQLRPAWNPFLMLGLGAGLGWFGTILLDEFSRRRLDGQSSNPARPSDRSPEARVAKRIISEVQSDYTFWQEFFGSSSWNEPRRVTRLASGTPDAIESRVRTWIYDDHDAGRDFESAAAIQAKVERLRDDIKSDAMPEFKHRVQELFFVVEKSLTAEEHALGFDALADELTVEMANRKLKTEKELRSQMGPVVKSLKSRLAGAVAARQRQKQQQARDEEQRRAQKQAADQAQFAKEQQAQEDRRRREADEAARQANHEREKERQKQQEEETKRREEARLAPERPRRTAARHQAELAFVDHAADVKGVFGLGDFELWRNANLGDEMPLDAVEANASSFSTLLKKFAVHRRLRTLYDELACEVEESYSRDMLDNFVRTRLSVEKELEDVVAAAKELESRLVNLSARVKRDRAMEKLKATKREMDKRAEGAEALAAVVGAMPIFDDGERQEMERMARDAADGTRRSVFDDLLKKETGNVTRALRHES